MTDLGAWNTVFHESVEILITSTIVPLHKQTDNNYKTGYG